MIDMLGTFGEGWRIPFQYHLFSILYFMSIVIIYNNYTAQNNILIKTDGVVYSYIAEITNTYKYYSRNIQNPNY